jgi:hypothetical protein
MKYLLKVILLFLMQFFLFSCSKSEKANMSVNTLEFNTTLWGFGLGRTKEIANLSAITLIAQQKEGIRFIYSKNGIAFKTKNVTIKGAHPVSYYTLSDGRQLCIMSVDAKVKTKRRLNRKSFSTIANFLDLVNNREEILTTIIRGVYKNRVQRGEKIKGLLYITGIEIPNTGQRLPEKVTLKVTLLN